MCTCRPLLPAVHRPSGASCATAPCPTATCRSRTSAWPAQWDDLQIPVGVAFFFRNSALERVVAFYPSPAGATESRAAARRLGARSLARDHPQLAPLRARRRGAAGARRPDGDRGGRVLPRADRRLLRAGRPAAPTWRGFDGGQEARDALDGFFDRVAPGASRRPSGGREPARPSTVARRRRRAVRRRAELTARLRIDGDHRRRRCTRSRCAARSASSRSAAATTDAEEERLRELFGDRDRWARHAQAVPVDAVPTMVPGLHRRDRGRPARAVHLRLRGGAARKYLHALDDGEIPLSCCSAAPCSPAARRASRSQPVPVGRARRRTACRSPCGGT